MGIDRKSVQDIGIERRFDALNLDINRARTKIGWPGTTGKKYPEKD